jgi:hypothetical protein
MFVKAMPAEQTTEFLNRINALISHFRKNAIRFISEERNEF